MPLPRFSNILTAYDGRSGRAGSVGTVATTIVSPLAASNARLNRSSARSLSAPITLAKSLTGPSALAADPARSRTSTARPRAQRRSAHGRQRIALDRPGAWHLRVSLFASPLIHEFGEALDRLQDTRGSCVRHRRSASCPATPARSCRRSGAGRGRCARRIRHEVGLVLRGGAIETRHVAEAARQTPAPIRARSRPPPAGRPPLFR